MKIEKGTPATILYMIDTRAAVVVKATAKRVWVSRVETGPARHENENLAPGELPVVIEEGMIDKPLSDTGIMYSLYTRNDGSVYAARGGRYSRDRVVFGHSISRTDYKF